MAQRTRVELPPVMESLRDLCPSSNGHQQCSAIALHVGEAVLERVPPYLQQTRPGARAALVADRHTWRAAGERLRQSFVASGGEADVCLVPPAPGRNEVIPDEQALATVSQLTQPATVLIAVGSGTIHDLVRRVAFRTARPFVSVPTAPSVDGFVSPVAAILRGGVKVTLPGQPPEAVFADLDVLCAAPAQLVSAGFGDLMGKFTAAADWLLAHVLTGEAFSDRLVEAELRAARLAVARAEGIAHRDREPIRLLMEGLLTTGLCMLLHGDSRPASGAEHHLSHYWEMTRLAAHRDHPLHGQQVAVATVLVARVYAGVFRRLRSSPKAKRRPVHPEERRWRIQRCFGPLAARLFAENGSEPPSWGGELLQPGRTAEGWNSLSQRVEALLPPADVLAAALKRAGAPAEPGAVGLSAEEVCAALRGAKEVRARYTVLQLAEELGWLDELAEEIGQALPASG